MKLGNVITLRLALLKALLIGVWAFGFYYAIVLAINRETDTALRNYAETLILRFLSDEVMPAPYDGSNNSYHLRKVSGKYAESHEHIVYEDRDVFFREQNDYEPARTITYIFRDNNDSFQELTVYTPTIDKDNLKKTILFWIVLLYIAIVVGMIVLNIWTVRHSMRPLHRLLGWVEAYHLGGKNMTFDNPTSISEFQSLNDVVTRSMIRSEEAYEEQKRFVANASHELQTPVAAAMNRLEMLLQDEGLSESQMGEVVKSLHSLRSLSSMNRSLLLLCRIEGGQFTEIEMVSLLDMARKVLADLETLCQRKRVHVTVSNECVAFPVRIDSSLARVLMTNLLKNAVVHNRVGGIVNVYSSQKLFVVENTGQDVQLDATLVFERFYHTPSATESTGLGLSIVKAICQRCGLSVSYSFVNGLHRFELRRS